MTTQEQFTKGQQNIPRKKNIYDKIINPNSGVLNFSIIFLNIFYLTQFKI